MEPVGVIVEAKRFYNQHSALLAGREAVDTELRLLSKPTASCHVSKATVGVSVFYSPCCFCVVILSGNVRQSYDALIQRIDQQGRLQPAGMDLAKIS